jgi:hypothetical protein
VGASRDCAEKRPESKREKIENMEELDQWGKKLHGSAARFVMANFC